MENVCGFYRCGELPGEIELARFPPARAPAAAAAPGRGLRRNSGVGQNLPKGAVMLFPNWNGAPGRIIPPSHQLTPGRRESTTSSPKNRHSKTGLKFRASESTTRRYSVTASLRSCTSRRRQSRTARPICAAPADRSGSPGAAGCRGSDSTSSIATSLRRPWLRISSMSAV
ncbi:DUF2380 domain-containing protein [Pyxidicoccus sp. MSG2]|nr:DUF2380 domain-containing protein [Pyxidicoccus sp. MSG2]